MKVISGFLKGRTLLGFDIKGTRPTMDRVKESLFAMIQARVEDSICLDLFAGSGSLGIEAISNGASHCTLVDANLKATTVIQKNLQTFQITSQASVFTLDYQVALSLFEKQKQTFDLVFLDPPYQTDYVEDIMTRLMKGNLLKEGALVIWEVEHPEQIKEYSSFTLSKKRQYGDKWIFIFEKTC